MTSNDATFETHADGDEDTRDAEAVVKEDDVPAEDSGESSGVSTAGDRNPFDDHEATQEEIDQLEKERQERLDPENRWENAEVDNTQREWVSEEEDFRDNLEGNPPEWDKGDGAGTTRDPEIWKHLEEQTGKPIDS